VSVAPKAPKIPGIGIPTSGADINRINRTFWSLKLALEAAGLPDSKMQRILDSLLFEIAAGSVNAKSSHGGKRSGMKRKAKAAQGWQAIAGPRADEIKRDNPLFKPNRIMKKMKKEDPTGLLPGGRTLAKFIAKRNGGG
jgi:hypothetical protein